MTRKEQLEYRRNCPYDAMGDYSRLAGHSEDKNQPEKEPVKTAK